MQLWRAFLSLITLGIHRFWWRTANRRRLWEETSVDGDPLDYRGHGMDLLKGALLASVVVFLPLAVLGQLVQLLGIVGFDGPVALGVGLLGQLVALLAVGFLIGYAVWRSRRYLLSRTAWRGIRAGMAGTGWPYARLHFRLLLLQIITLGLATPYAEARRWNAIWTDARFGTEAFDAAVAWRPLVRPWLLSLGLAIGLFVVLPLLAIPLAAGAFGLEELPDPGQIPDAGPSQMMVSVLAVIIAGLVVASLLLPLAFVPWRAAFLSAAVGATRLGDLRFGFAATRSHWLWYLLGNALLVILTLGLGALLLPWRQWEFWTTHLRIAGRLDEETIRQSRLAAPSHGDGLAQGFDLGGI
jgi:uncharacterized membrane protein YjgN (DUF898 family)